MGAGPGPNWDIIIKGWFRGRVEGTLLALVGESLTFHRKQNKRDWCSTQVEQYATGMWAIRHENVAGHLDKSLAVTAVPAFS